MLQRRRVASDVFWCSLSVLALISGACSSGVPRLDHLPPGDERIVAELRGALEAEERIDAEAIELECSQGVVVLRGFLRDRDQVRRALELASRVDGVVEVVNRLRVLRGEV